MLIVTKVNAAKLVHFRLKVIKQPANSKKNPTSEIERLTSAIAIPDSDNHGIVNSMKIAYALSKRIESTIKNRNIVD